MSPCLVSKRHLEYISWITILVNYGLIKYLYDPCVEARVVRSKCLGLTLITTPNTTFITHVVLDFSLQY